MIMYSSRSAIQQHIEAGRKARAQAWKAAFSALLARRRPARIKPAPRFHGALPA